MQGGLSLGIQLGRSGAEAALVHRARKARVLGAAAVQTSVSMLDPLDEAALATSFRALARQLPRAARRADVAVSVSLPDPLIREDVFDFAAFPEKDAEAAALVHQRAARETWAEADKICCSFQRLGAADGGARVLVRTMPRALRDAVEAAAGAAGFRVTQLDAWSGFLLRAMGRGKLPAAGAFLWADTQSWVLICWCDAQPEGFVESGTLSIETEDEVARKIVRLVRSYELARDLTDLQFAVEASERLMTRLSALTPSGGTAPAPALLSGPRERPAERIAIWR